MDNTDKGYIKVYRSLFVHQLWKEKPFSNAQAWIDLIQLAFFSDSQLPLRGSKVECKRGDVNISKKKLGERWGWSRSRTNHFLERLEQEKMIIVNASRQRTIIEILNYEKYQSVASDDPFPAPASEPKPKRTSGRKNKKDTFREELEAWVSQEMNGQS